MEFAQKISWNWFIWFHEFFWPWLFQFSGPQCVCSLFTFFVFILAIAIVETMVTMRKMTKKMMRNMIQCLAWTQIVSHLPNFCLGVFPRSVPDFQAMSTLRQIFVLANLLCEPSLPNLQYRFVFLHFWWFFQSGAHTDVPSTHCSADSGCSFCHYTAGQKKLMKSNKSISRKNWFDQIPFFAISEMAKSQFLNWEKV